MTKSIIHSYQSFSSLTSQKNDIYKVKFEIRGVHPSLANGLRRALLGYIPIAAFDDTYMDNPENNYIKMKKNVSALHNEFVAHRLSLIPITMYYNDSLRVLLDYNFEKCEFSYDFLSADAVPTFQLKIKNDDETRKTGSNPDNSIDVTTQYITINNPDDFNPVGEFLIPDYITGDYLLIHRLKPISSNEEVQEAEELDITLKPNINIGRIHARYCPVGTVSYEFAKDSIDVQNKYFEQYIQTLKEQRANDKLAPFSEADINQFRGSFNVMGSERVYKKNEWDEPETVLMCVESVGNLEAHQLVYDALEIIRLRTYVLMNSFEWNEKANQYSYNPNKVSIQKNKQSGLIEIILAKEDHTLGNLIGSYLKKLFIFTDLLNFATYRSPHPLEERIIITIGFKEGVDLTGVFSKVGLKAATHENDKAIQCMFMACSAYLKQIETMKADWTKYTNIRETSFSLADKELLRTSYYDRSAQI